MTSCALAGAMRDDGSSTANHVFVSGTLQPITPQPGHLLTTPAAQGLQDGAWVEVEVAGGRGRCRLRVKFSDAQPADVVSYRLKGKRRAGIMARPHAKEKAKADEKA